MPALHLSYRPEDFIDAPDDDEQLGYNAQRGGLITATRPIPAPSIVPLIPTIEVTADYGSGDVDDLRGAADMANRRLKRRQPRTDELAIRMCVPAWAAATHENGIVSLFCVKCWRWSHPPCAKIMAIRWKARLRLVPFTHILTDWTEKVPPVRQAQYARQLITALGRRLGMSLAGRYVEMRNNGLFSVALVLPEALDLPQDILDKFHYIMDYSFTYPDLCDQSQPWRLNQDTIDTWLDFSLDTERVPLNRLRKVRPAPGFWAAVKATEDQQYRNTMTEDEQQKYDREEAEITRRLKDAESNRLTNVIFDVSRHLTEAGMEERDAWVLAWEKYETAKDMDYAKAIEFLEDEIWKKEINLLWVGHAGKDYHLDSSLWLRQESRRMRDLKKAVSWQWITDKKRFIEGYLEKGYRVHAINALYELLLPPD